MATVSDIMHRDVIAVHPEDDIASLLRVLREHELPGVPSRLIAQRRHNRLPVVDEDGKLLGLLTRVDVLEALAA